MKIANHRKGFKHVNKYQMKILMLSFVPCTLLCLCMTILLNVFFNDFGKALFNERTIIDIAYVKHWFLLILGSLWCFFTLLIIWVFQESNHLVGAFDRVKRELKELSEGRKKGPIVVRDKDHLFKEILDSINVIIKKLYNNS